MKTEGKEEDRGGGNGSRGQGARQIKRENAGTELITFMVIVKKNQMIF